MNHPLRCCAASAAGARCLAPGTRRASAGPDWPQQPVTIFMGFPAGSGVDVVARMLQPSLEKSLGQRAGRSTTSPAPAATSPPSYVARATPDGYTFLLGTAATHGVNAALYKRLPFDVEADFTPISTLNDVSNVLTINPDVIDADVGARTSSPR